MQSIVSALLMAGVREEDMSQHVYHLIAMWFSCGDNNNWMDGIDEIISEAVGKIPMFCFVPLVT